MNKDELLIALSESEHTQFDRVDFADQPEQQKVFSAVWALESTVSIGGFLNFFVNWDGNTAAFAPTALRTIGARACAKMVERALRLASSSPLPPLQSAREKLLESLPEEILEQLEDLDELFLEYPDDLIALLFDYVSRHSRVFGPIEVPDDD